MHSTCIRLIERNFFNNIHFGIGVLISGLLLGSSAQAAQCEIPLFVKQGLSGAAAMILADNSGSMNAPIFDLRYDHNTDYSGDFNPTSTINDIGSDDMCQLLRNRAIDQRLQLSNLSQLRFGQPA